MYVFMYIILFKYIDILSGYSQFWWCFTLHVCFILLRVLQLLKLKS